MVKEVSRFARAVGAFCEGTASVVPELQQRRKTVTLSVSLLLRAIGRRRLPIAHWSVLTSLPAPARIADTEVERMLLGREEVYPVSGRLKGIRILAPPPVMQLRCNTTAGLGWMTRFIPHVSSIQRAILGTAGGVLLQ